MHESQSKLLNVFARFLVETFHLYQGLGCLFNSKVTPCLNPYFPFVTDSSSASRKRKYLKLSKTAIKNALNRAFLASGNQSEMFSFYPCPWPGERAFISRRLFVLLSEKKVSCGNIVPTDELACVLHSPLSCLSFSVVLFSILALSPCSPALSYSSLRSFSIIPAPQCRVRAALLL